jgi:hypothetical protein
MAEKHITLIPYGGLANRMKAIESLLHLLGDAEAEGMLIKNLYIPTLFQQLFYRDCLHENEVTQRVYDYHE